MLQLRKYFLEEAFEMIKRLVSILLVVMMVVLMVPAAMANETWYVYTDDGKTLNVREKPNGAVVGRLAFGAPVDVVVYSPNGWSLIYFVNGELEGEAYVMSRFLVRYKPTVKPSGSVTPASTTPAANAGTTGTDTVANLNKEFRTARKVSAYTVVARPSRASGWVNLRWAPSLEAERIATCSQGKELIVVAELANWYQVEDPATGMIGFISRKFVTAK